MLRVETVEHDGHEARGDGLVVEGVARELRRLEGRADHAVLRRPAEHDVLAVQVLEDLGAGLAVDAVERGGEERPADDARRRLHRRLGDVDDLLDGPGRAHGPPDVAVAWDAREVHQPQVVHPLAVHVDEGLRAARDGAPAESDHAHLGDNRVEGAKEAEHVLAVLVPLEEAAPVAVDLVEPQHRAE